MKMNTACIGGFMLGAQGPILDLRGAHPRPVWKISIHYARCLPTLIHKTWHRNCAKFIVFALEKYFVDLGNLVDLFGLFGHFLDLLRLFH